jgi:hypothetical protein
MRRILSAAIVTLAAAFSSHTLADSMGMSTGAPMPTTIAYRFELVGPVQSNGGKSVVSVRLIHIADNKAVVGAIIISSHANMSPIGMAGMTGPIKSLGEQPRGTYRFEVENGSVWHKPDNWSLSFSAKVQGVTQTVTGSVTVMLTP